MEEFENQVPPNTLFPVGYFEGRQSIKKWLVTQEDLLAMYSMLEECQKTEVCLWCDVEEEKSKKRKKDSSPPPSKRSTKEKEIDDITAELKTLHKEEQYSDPQFRLWARMVVNGLHSSKEIPPQIPLITGITPTRGTRKSMQDTVASTVSAVMKAVGSPHQLQMNSPASSTTGIGVSPSKAVDLRGKCLAQLSNLKQLFEDSVITEDELEEQKQSILRDLRKL